MRGRLFKLSFLALLGVQLISLAILSLWLYRSVPEVDLPRLFTPLVLLAELAVTLSVVVAALLSRSVTKPLHNIDMNRPDERDVAEELRPLVRRLVEQNKQIRSQMDALAAEHQRQDTMRREFTANVSHELKTPLTSISGFAELMGSGMVAPEDIQPLAGCIYDETQHMIRLVGDIIRLSRLEDGSLPLEYGELSLRELVQSLEKQLAPAAGQLGVTLAHSGDPGRILTAPRVCEDILYNLCDNAVKYNRPGGRVDISVEDRESEAVVTIRDTGIGIAEEELSRIFERFYRVDKSHSREVGGTGLGLSIVKHGAAAVQAKLHMESEPGRGTAVSIRFPRSLRTEENSPN